MKKCIEIVPKTLNILFVSVNREIKQESGREDEIEGKWEKRGEYRE